ncbi:glycosyl hydrolase family 71 protein [Aspergillus flavus AF70]|nr:glycosyl hydrolase family 71 protein [Aspergillus flavus AF70]
MQLLLLVVLLVGACPVQAKAVFAHFMLGNSDNYTKANWEQDISAAKEAHIDAFAINTGFGLSIHRMLTDAFAAADELDFKLFLSLDYSGDGHWPQDQVIDYLKDFTKLPAYFKTDDDKPLVSTFEGDQAVGDWKNIKDKVDCFFIPEWSALRPEKAISYEQVDGLMSWTAWPNGTDPMTTETDKEYLDALNGKPYIMPVSPWFYTNLVRYHKNWVWQGDDLWYTRWQQVLELEPEYVEILTWNDYGESHYIGPIHQSGLAVFDYGQAPFDYAKDMPHDGWRSFLPYVIDLYKNGGKDADIKDEGLVSWYRVNPASACSSGKTTGNTETQAQQTLEPQEVLQDKVFFSALLESSADISVTIDGKARAASWVDTPDGGKGIYHGSIPIDNQTGAVVVTLTRDNELLAEIDGHPITSDCVKNMTNWNAWVGNATSTGPKPSSPSGSSEQDSSTNRLVSASMSGSLEALTRPSGFFVRHASRTSTNTRIPPIARRSASPIPSRIALLSRDKLERETAAKNPDLRRCLGHQRLLRRSIEAAQEDMRRAMASFKLEDSDDEDEILGDDYDSSPSPMIREQITRAVKAMVKRRATSQVHETDNANSTPQLMRESSKKESSCDLSSRQHNAYYRAPSVTTGRRKHNTKFAFTRLLWSSSGQSMQAMAS